VDYNGQKATMMKKMKKAMKVTVRKRMMYLFGEKQLQA